MDVCPYCGLPYDDFRTGMTFKEVRSLFWVEDEDPAAWKYKRRHTVLGKWRQIKLELFSEHINYCERETSLG